MGAIRAQTIMWLTVWHKDMTAIMETLGGGGGG